jgi:hypothetical protein
VFPLTPSNPRSRTSEDVVYEAASLWLSLESCRSLVDDDDTASRMTEAMGCLDEIARLICLLPSDERQPWVDGLDDVKDLVDGIYGHVHGEASSRD